MKKYFLPLLLLAACNQTSHSSLDEQKDSTVVVSHDTIPETRQTVSPAPAAEYSEPIKDELNKWKFAVEMYETKRTFHYTLRIQCKEIRVSDSVNIPNFGIYPKVAVKKGKKPLSCIIGFYDKKNEFKEYREVSFSNEQLHFRTINSYYVASYKTKQ